MRVIEEATLRERLREAEGLESAKRAFTALAGGRVLQPPSLGFELPDRGGEVHAKGAYLEGAPVFALKVATGFYGNAARGLPSGSGVVIVFDAETGFPLGVLADNGYLTDLRTAAAGALAADLLAARRVERVAVIGAGVQARFQLRAISRVRHFAGGAVWSPHRERATACAAELSAELRRPIVAAASPRDAVVGAALVVTATPSRAPLLEADWLADGVTVVAVGSDGPEKRELADDVLRMAKVVVDSTAQCLRWGELHHAVAAGVLSAGDVHAELGQVLTGARPGREGDERIVCDLTGVGAQDAAIAEMAWQAAS